MRHFIFLVLAIAFTSYASTYVAVLESISESDVIGHSEKMFITDRLRSIAQKTLPAYMDYVIMTRENINAMLPPGKSIEDCEGSCLAETGRNISANFVSQARIGKFGSKYTISVELYDTQSNNLIGSFTALSTDADGLLEEIDRQAEKMFKNIMGQVPVAPKVAETPKPQEIAVKQEATKPQEKKQEKPFDDKTLTDPRDNNTYPIVKIGSQFWTATNLNYKKQNTPCYDNNKKYCKTLGRLYSIDDALKACPDGWHLPTRYEMIELIDTLGGSSKAGESLKMGKDWRGFSLPSKSGFDAMLAGYAEGDDFSSLDGKGYYWTSSGGNDGYFVWKIGSLSNSIDWKMYRKDQGYKFSVRCMRDQNDKYFIDRRDNHRYRTVKIRKQHWMAVNIDYKTPNSVCYQRDEANCKAFGRLYTIEDALEACPKGWRLPTRKEMTSLFDAFGGEGKAGGSLKTNKDWYGYSLPSASGFDALLAGYGKKGEFSSLDGRGYYWTSSEEKGDYFIYKFSSMTDAMDWKTYDPAQAYEFSVRCIEE